jgi:hypothetical protein
MDELDASSKQALALHFENGSHPVEIDILVVSERNWNHAPAATDEDRKLCASVKAACVSVR